MKKHLWFVALVVAALFFSAGCSISSVPARSYLRCSVAWMNERSNPPMLGLVCVPERVKKV